MAVALVTLAWWIAGAIVGGLDSLEDPQPFFAPQVQEPWNGQKPTFLSGD